jgi:hypothetical protein
VGFRRRFAATLAFAQVRNLGWLLWTTRGLGRVDALRPDSLSADSVAPPRRVLLGIAVGTCAMGATVEAVLWAVTRPLLPRRPELARLVAKAADVLAYGALERRLKRAARRTRAASR